MNTITHRSAISFFCLYLLLSAVAVQAQSSQSTASQTALESLLLNETTWTLAPDEFMKAAQPLHFVWTSRTKGSARSVMPGVKLLDQAVIETVATFKANNIQSVLISIYNKGDTALIDMPTFEKMLTDINKRISELTASRPTVVTSKRATSVNLKSQTFYWLKGSLAFVLEYASSQTKDPSSRRSVEFPEYINLTILKGGYKEVQEAAGDQKVSVNQIALKKNIKQESNGDVHLTGIPMVDQGQKGYCANATTERVLRYYGVDVNQHKLAQVARTSAAGGTSSDALLEALKAMAGMMYLRVNVMSTTDVRDLIKTMKDYNAEARRQNKPEIPIPTGGVLDMGAIMRAMKSDVYIKSRATNPSHIKQFESNVKSKIDRGIPLIWSVTLGFVQENPPLPQAFGGHMRLIIGYNSRTQEIIYTDSWGEGHEFKRMSTESAHAITKGLFSLEPML